MPAPQPTKGNPPTRTMRKHGHPTHLNSTYTPAHQNNTSKSIRNGRIMPHRKLPTAHWVTLLCLVTILPAIPNALLTHAAITPAPARTCRNLAPPRIFQAQRPYNPATARGLARAVQSVYAGDQVWRDTLFNPMDQCSTYPYAHSNVTGLSSSTAAHPNAPLGNTIRLRFLAYPDTEKTMSKQDKIAYMTDMEANIRNSICTTPDQHMQLGVTIRAGPARLGPVQHTIVELKAIIHSTNPELITAIALALTDPTHHLSRLPIWSCGSEPGDTPIRTTGIPLLQIPLQVPASIEAEFRVTAVTLDLEHPYGPLVPKALALRAIFNKSFKNYI